MAKTTADTIEQYEKYVRGEPLNEEMAALMDGEESPRPQVEPIGARVRDLRELDEVEREQLRRLTVDPGYRVFLRLLDRDIKAQEDQIRTLSLTDPLGQKDAVAAGWAYVAMMQRMQKRVLLIIDEELAKIKK